MIIKLSWTQTTRHVGNVSIDQLRQWLESEGLDVPEGRQSEMVAALSAQVLLDWITATYPTDSEVNRMLTGVTADCTGLTVHAPQVVNIQLDISTIEAIADALDSAAAHNGDAVLYGDCVGCKRQTEGLCLDHADDHAKARRWMEIREYVCRQAVAAQRNGAML